MTKTTTTKERLAARVEENRCGRTLTPAQDRELLEAYIAKPKPGERKPSLRSVAADFGHSVMTVRRAIARAAEEEP